MGFSLPDLVGRVRLDTSGFHAGVTEAASATGELKSRFGELAKAGLELAGIGAAGEFFKGAIEEARDGAAGMRETSERIKEMGNASNVTAGQVSQLSQKLGEHAGIDDDVIRKGENMLLTFGHIRNEVGKGNDIFNQASATMTDYAVKFTHGDMETAAIQLGKALDNPTKGISALQRVGVSFDASEQQAIKTAMSHNDVLSAQKVILGEVNKQVGGAAAAAADPAQRFNVALKDLEQNVGNYLLPLLNKALSALNAGMGFLGSHIGTIAAVAKAVFRDIADAWAAAMARFRGPVAAAAAAINTIVPIIVQVFDWLAGQVRALIAVFEIEWPKISAIIQDVFEIIKPIVMLAMGIIYVTIEAVLATIEFIWNTWGQNIITSLQIAWGIISVTIQTALNVILDVVRLALDLLTGKWGQAWEDFKTLLSDAWEGIKVMLGLALAAITNALDAAWEGIKAAAGLAWDAFKAVITGAWDAIKSAVGDALSAVGGAISGEWATIKQDVDSAWSGIKGAIGDAWSGIKTAVSSGIGEVVGVVGGFASKIVGAIPNPLGMLKSVGGDIVSGLASGISDAWHAVTDRISSLINAIPGPVRKLLGISSPSKVFMEIGRNVTQGLALGIGDGQAQVNVAMSKLAGSVAGTRMPSPSAALGLSAPGSVASSGSGGGMVGGNSYTVNLPLVPYTPQQVGNEAVAALNRLEVVHGLAY
jgi:hypothetical protein